MSKKKSQLVDELSPSIDQQVLELTAGPTDDELQDELLDDVASDPSDEELPTEPLQPVSIGAATMTVPVARMQVNGFIRRRIDLRLSRRQADSLKRIMLALQTQDARLADRRPVKNVTDALRWMLDQLA